MTRILAEDTQPSLRALAGWICPRCRYRRGTPAAHANEIVRCPQDGHALVTSNELADADGDPFLGTTVAGRFVVVGRLGAGSMGTVYRARQEAMGRNVAIKILRSDRAFDAQAKARFTREARAMSLLTSPHTVTVFDFGEIPSRDSTLDAEGGGGSLYLAMEMLEGESLGARLKRARRLRVDEAIRIAHHTLLSLAEAHEKGVIHRDLKPDNLFLVRPQSGAHDELCKVLDFGIAKVVTDTNGAVDALETQAGTVFGTPRYMSPEQAQAKPLDARSDLYSLGVILYQMLVGRAPFVDDDAVVVMARHIKSVPVPPSDAAPDAGIPQAISDVVMRVLAKDPGDRPANAKAFIAALEQAIRAPAAPISRPTAPQPVVGTGEMTAVTREDMTAMLQVRPRGFGRRTIMLVAAVGVVVTITSAALLVGTLRPAPMAGPAAALGARTEAAGADRAPAAGEPVSAAGAPAPRGDPSSAPGPAAAGATLGDPGSAAPTGAPAGTSSATPAPRATTSASAAVNPASPPSPSGRRTPPRPKGYTRFE